MPGSLKEALRQALEEDDARETAEATPPIEPIVETEGPKETTFTEQAGRLVPQEVTE